MKYHINADNHACDCVVMPVNSFGLANLIDITTCIAGASYFYHWDGPGVFYGYFLCELDGCNIF